MVFYDELSGFRFLSMYYTIFIFTFWHYTIYYTIFLKNCTIRQQVTIFFLHCHITLNPYKSRISGCLCTLFLIAHLEDVKLQIIRFIRRPEDRMVRCLCPEFHLSEPTVDAFSGLRDRLCKQLIIHKMRAGAGSKIAPVFYELHPPHVDLPISFHSIFDRTS